MELHLIIIVIICSTLVVMGILVHNFKIYSLMAGYDTMPPDEKNSINWHSYSRFIRNVFFCFSTLLLIGYFLRDYFNINYYIYALYVVLIDFFTIYLVFWGKNKYSSKDTNTE